MGRYELVAPCGDYCGGCGQYNGLVSETARQLRELAALYGFEFRSQGAFDFGEFLNGLEWFIDNAQCPGCRQGGGPAWCEVKQCCSQKGLRICFECEQFPCSKMDSVADPDTVDRNRRFREVGYEAWVKEQEERAEAGYEIHLQKVARLTPQQRGSTRKTRRKAE